MIEQVLAVLWYNIGIVLQVSYLKVQYENEVKDHVECEERLEPVVDPLALVFHLFACFLEYKVHNEIHIQGPNYKDQEPLLLVDEWGEDVESVSERDNYTETGHD